MKKHLLKILFVVALATVPVAHYYFSAPLTDNAPSQDIIANSGHHGGGHAGWYGGGNNWYGGGHSRHEWNPEWFHGWYGDRWGWDAGYNLRVDPEYGAPDEEEQQRHYIYRYDGDTNNEPYNPDYLYYTDPDTGEYFHE